MGGTEVAICIVGQLRTLLSAPVRESFHHQVLDVLHSSGHRTSTFAAVVIGRGHAVGSSVTEAIRSNFTLEGLVVLNDPSPPKNRSHQSLSPCVAALPGRGADLQQWLTLTSCFTQVEAHESRRRVNFGWVYKLRTDIVHLGPVELPLHLSRAFVYLPAGGMSSRSELQCMNDHLFLCPRELCRPYFGLSELFETECISGSKFIVEEDAGASHSVLMGTKRSRLPHGAADLADGELDALRQPPRRPTLLPAVPSGFGIQWYFYARYSDGRTCRDGASAPPACCGLLRERPWRYAIARGDAPKAGRIECGVRLLHSQPPDGAPREAGARLTPAERASLYWECLRLEARWQPHSPRVRLLEELRHAPNVTRRAGFAAAQKHFDMSIMMLRCNLGGRGDSGC